MTDQPVDQQPMRMNHPRNQPVWRDHFFLVMGGGAAILAAAILVMWVVVNFAWATEDITWHTTLSAPVDHKAVLEIYYPALIPANNAPVDFLFVLRSDTPLVQTTTITVEIPSGLRVLGAGTVAITATSTLTTAMPIESQPVTDADASPKVLSIEFDPQSEDRAKSIRFLNARTENTWWLFLPGNAQCLTVTLPSSLIQASPPCFRIETTPDRAWRNFVNNAVNDKSPLVILAVSLLSLAGAAVSRWWNQWQAEQEKERARKDQVRKDEQAKKEQQESKNQQRASSALAEFRAAMRDQQSAKARQAFGEMQKPELLPYISPEDLARARYLINLMDGEISESLISSAAAAWPAETAGALEYAAKNNPKDRAGLLRAFRTFPLDKLTPEYRQSFEKAKEEFGVPSLQARKWPQLPEFHDQQPLLVTDSVAGKIGFHLFVSEYAEEEQALLFDKSLAFFWPEHILCQHMMTNTAPEIIWGRSGTGKTALGLALGEYPVDEVKGTLGCYLAGLPALSNIQISFASKLLAFVQYHPTFLSRLGQYDRHLLAQLLVSLLGRDLVLAKIRTLPDDVKNWQKEPGDEKSRLLRESNVQTQLRLLEQDVNAGVAQPDLTATQWSLALVHCAHVLGFKQIRLVLDAAGDQCPEWLQRFVLPSLNAWTEAGIVVKIIVPDEVATALQLPAYPARLGALTCHQLRWRNDQMQQMIEWRHQRSGTNVALAEVIGDDVLDEMIAMSHLNPGCFVRLWNAAATLDLKDGRITLDIVQQVEKQVPCP